MTLDEISVPPGVPLARAAQAIETFVETTGLRITTRGTLAEYPGSIHWHIKRGKESGTLEATLLNRERRVKLEVRKGREGIWTTNALEALSMALGNLPVSDTAAQGNP